MYMNTKLLLAPLILTLSACTTTPVAIPPPKPYIDAALRRKCAPLPKLNVVVGEDLKPAILLNRIESEAVHDVCAARGDSILKAIGVDVID